MADSKFERALAHVFQVEGGFVDDARDAGGRTDKGITQKTYNAWRKTVGLDEADVKGISTEEAAEIYKSNYWDPIRGDDLPEALGMLMMDASVNLGPGRAAKMLQKLLNKMGASPKLTVDGQVGRRTLSALASASEERVLDEYVVQRGLYYVTRPTFEVFGLGWARRLVSAARSAYAILDRSRERGDDLPRTEVAAPVPLSRYFHAGTRAQAYGSFFQLWGGWITAAHVIKEMDNTLPPFATGALQNGPGGLDAALIGATLPASPPPEPTKDTVIVALGYPAGAGVPARRRAKVYRRRPNSTVWIAQIMAPSEPVVVGMSGGIVFEEGSQTPIGILVHRNSPADLDQDGVLDQSFDFVALSDVYAAVSGRTPVMA